SWTWQHETHARAVSREGIPGPGSPAGPAAEVARLPHLRFPALRTRAARLAPRPRAGLVGGAEDRVRACDARAAGLDRGARGGGPGGAPVAAQGLADHPGGPNVQRRDLTAGQRAIVAARAPSPTATRRWPGSSRSAGGARSGLPSGWASGKPGYQNAF